MSTKSKVIPQADRLRRPPTVESDFTRREAADLLGCGLCKVDELIADGTLASYKIGSNPRSGRRIRRDSIEALRRGSAQSPNIAAQA